MAPNCEIRVIPVPLAGEILPGDDLAEKLAAALRHQKLKLQTGDVLVVKHKIVSKAEGLVVRLIGVTPSQSAKAWSRRTGADARLVELALSEGKRIVRKQKGVLITQTRHGFVCANSGVDVSNVDGGSHALLLPEDPDRSAASLSRAIKSSTGFAIPVIITDSFGRPWREGLTEFAIGISGMKPLRDDRGRRDSHGYKLRASVEAVADELACAAGLVCGKLNRAPACLVRGFHYDLGKGSVRNLLRRASTDLFR